MERIRLSLIHATQQAYPSNDNQPFQVLHRPLRCPRQIRSILNYLRKKSKNLFFSFIFNQQLRGKFHLWTSSKPNASRPLKTINWGSFFDASCTLALPNFYWNLPPLFHSGLISFFFRNRSDFGLVCNQLSGSSISRKGAKRSNAEKRYKNKVL